MGILGSLGAVAGGIFGGPAGAAIGGALGGAFDSSRAAGKAADAQQAATDASIGLQRYQYDTTRADNMPALQARNTSLARVQEMLGIGGDARSAGYGSWSRPITPQNVQADPGYQFGLSQGNQNIQGSAAASGGLFSGATGKALTRYGSDYATTKYGDAYNRLAADQDRSRNALMQLAGAGQSGASTIAQSGENYANGAGTALTNMGNARGASIIAGGNAMQSGVNALAYGLNRNTGGAQSNSWWGGVSRRDDPYRVAGYFGGDEGE